MDKLDKIFKVITFLDNIRWSSISNYNLINFSNNNISNDAKILTHWFCYIANRGMQFERVWDIGGYVFSELVDKIKNAKNLKLLDPDTPEAFIKKNDKKDGFAFISQTVAGNNNILKQYEFNINEKVKFASRYYPSDYFSILYTLYFLKDYNFSFSKFIKEVYIKYKDKNDFIKRVLYSMYLVTYYEISQPKKDDIKDFETNLNKADIRTKKIKEILKNKKTFEKEYLRFLKKDVFHQKRVWCSLRDFVKSVEFKKYFKNALKEAGLNDIKIFTSKKSLIELELPGDVWNNNSKFRNCILSNTIYEKSKEELNKILRKYFKGNTVKIGYPEQFDVTFDFVPRMCEKNNCNICPIQIINNKKINDFEKICVNKKSKYCSFAMISCNYKKICYEKDCKLKKIISNEIK